MSFFTAFITRFFAFSFKRLSYFIFNFNCFVFCFGNYFFSFNFRLLFIYRSFICLTFNFLKSRILRILNNSFSFRLCVCNHSFFFFFPLYPESFRFTAKIISCRTVVHFNISRIFNCLFYRNQMRHFRKRCRRVNYNFVFKRYKLIRSEYSF